MPLFNLFKYNVDASIPKPSTQAAFVQAPEKAGLLVTNELERALEDCKERVARIAKDCRAKNRKFRDIEFDLEKDRMRCLHGLVPNDEAYSPSDIQRVTQIFHDPKFFVDGASSSDIVQGAIGDCWFVAALATMATADGLVEKFCVARDEQVGIYGFIFFRDAKWVNIIIDDMLYTSIPKYEELSAAEKQLYHNDKAKYNDSARKGSKSLYFARSSTAGETWVPLMEKAYAKLHGSYGALSGGFTAEAIEDLTGGISGFIPSKDILDIDKFWNEELMKVNTDRLFSCAYQGLDWSRSGEFNAKISGLIGGHAYSVLRCAEYNGKRFVVVRNPWGQSEWTGPWSDGSKEWTHEWLAALPVLGHTFGDDGEFIMEYKDFLDCWDSIDRTLLFDSSWVMSCQWLQVQARPLPTAWTFGDVSFTISIPKPSYAVIVLSELDSRFYSDLSSRSLWTFDFIVFKKGEKDMVACSSIARLCARSVSAEVNLDAGDYVVHVRLDRREYRAKDYYETNAEEWDKRLLSRMLMERAASQSVAQNFKAEEQAKFLPIPTETLAGEDLSALEAKALAIAKEKKEKEEAEAKAKKEKEDAEAKAKKEKEDAEAKSKEKEDSEAKTTKEEEVEKKKKAAEVKEEPKDGDKKDEVTIGEDSDTKATVTTGDGKTTITTKDIVVTIKNKSKPSGAPGLPPKAADNSEAWSDDENGSDFCDLDDALSDFGVDEVIVPVVVPPPDKPVDEVQKELVDLLKVDFENSIFLGLRVYTNKQAPAVIGGQLRHQMETSETAPL